MRTIFRFLLPLIAALSLAAHAQTLLSGADPYQARVPVADQSPAARDQALRDAMTQVLLRVSGPGAPGSAPALIVRASTLATHYTYERSVGDGSLQLVASFDRASVDAQLRAAGLPVAGYAQAPAETLSLNVRGLRSGSDYGRTLAALRAVPGLRSVAVQAAEADQLLLAASVEGGSARLSTALASNRDLLLEGTTSSGALQLRLR